MNRRQARLRTASIAMMILVTALSVACGGGGGGGGGGTIPGGRTATFTPDNPTPGANTLSMAAGNSSGDTFWVDIEVTGITDFFGAGFRVNFDPATAQFTGNVDTSGSLIEGQGATTDFDAVDGAAGEVLVNATLQGQVQGVTPAGTDLLISLEFQATADTGANAFSYGMPRLVSTCPVPPAACTDLPDAGLTWSGGTMSAN